MRASSAQRCWVDVKRVARVRGRREGDRGRGGRGESRSEGDRRVMSLRELWSPETVAPKIRNDLSRLAGKQSVPTKPHPRDHHVTNVAAY